MENVGHRYKRMWEAEAKNPVYDRLTGNCKRRYSDMFKSEFYANFGLVKLCFDKQTTRGSEYQIGFDQI